MLPLTAPIDPLSVHWPHKQLLKPRLPSDSRSTNTKPMASIAVRINESTSFRWWDTPGVRGRRPPQQQRLRRHLFVQMGRRLYFDVLCFSQMQSCY